jgi:hypothetical protein
MKEGLGSAFWFESVLAFAAAFLAVLTLAKPQWNEEMFAADPDRGDGSFEWMLVVVLCLSASVFAALARRLSCKASVEPAVALAGGTGAQARIVAESTGADEKYENDSPISA